MIRVNGEEFPLRSGMNVRELIEEMDFDETKIAVEYNGEILPKSDYEKTVLKEGDVLEVVSFVGGG
ncbi:MAG TPA: sulfur carrier protein ThiS [Candidatus Blautia intestinigallinarum]|nr:sulfur carrier protein ThiS [Candidatus Blautia intestinigallinarum]